MKSRFALWMLACSLLLLVSPAMAHPGHDEVHGFSSGLVHPFHGADHVLAMIAVGLWAAQIGGRAMWLIPGAFAGFVALGAMLGVNGVPLPFVDGGMAASVVVLGLLIAMALRVPMVVAAVGVGVFALFHGHAHGAWLTAESSAVAFGAGFVSATVLLHAAGIVLGVLFRRTLAGRPLRLAGGAVTACGLLLLMGF